MLFGVSDNVLFVVRLSSSCVTCGVVRLVGTVRCRVKCEICHVCTSVLVYVLL